MTMNDQKSFEKLGMTIIWDTDSNVNKINDTINLSNNTVANNKVFSNLEFFDKWNVELRLRLSIRNY